MTSMLTQAAQSVMDANKARWSTILNISKEVMQKNDQSMAQVIQAESQAQKIMTEGLNSRGGKIDISV